MRRTCVPAIAGIIVKRVTHLALNKYCLLERIYGRLLKSEIAQRWVIIRTATQRPMILSFTLFDWKVIDAGDAQVHRPVLIELPILVAIAAKPIATIVVPFIGEANRDSVLAKRPNLLDQAVVKLAIPLARQKCFDFRSTPDKLRAIAPATVDCVGECDPSRITRVLCVFGHSRLLRGGLRGERGSGGRFIS